MNPNCGPVYNIGSVSVGTLVVGAIPQPRLVFTVKDGTLVVRGASSMILSTIQKVLLSIEPEDGKGNPAPVDGVPVWTTSGAFVLVEPEPDGLSAWASAIDVGHVQVAVKCDADLGEGVRELTATIEIDVMPAEAVSLNITAAAPVDQ